MGVSALDFNTYKFMFASLMTISTRSKSLYKAHRKKCQIAQVFLFLGKKTEQQQKKKKQPSIPNEGLVEASIPPSEKVRNKSEAAISIGS